MFHKEGSSSSSSSSGKKSSAVDVPLRKSDRRALRDRAVAYFLQHRGSNSNNVVDGNNNAEGVGESTEETISNGHSSSLTTCAEKIQAACDEIFLKGNLASRSLPVPGNEGNKATSMLLYLKTPSSNSDLTATYWPFETSSQFVWMALEEKKTVVQETPTVALWAALYQLIVASANPEIEGGGISMASFAVMIPSAASKYLCRGADLMKAGMLQVPTTAITVEGSSAAEKLASKKKNRNKNTYTFQNMVAITVRGNPQPFAVGMCKLTTNNDTTNNNNTNENMFGPGTKGIGVEIWNCYGDDLWRASNTKEQCQGTTHLNQMGGNAPFDNGHYGNVGFVKGQYVLPLVVVNDETKDDISEGNQAESTDANEEKDPGKDSDPEDTQNDQLNASKGGVDEDGANDSPDQVLHHAFCQALVNLKNKDLPMPTNTFYAQHVLPSRPEGTTINLKATAYKKFGNYLKEMVSQDIIKVGPDTSNKANTDPMALLLSYNKQHESLRSFSKTKSADNPDDGNGKKLVLVTLKIVPAHWTNLMRLNPDDVKAMNASSRNEKEPAC